MALVQSVRAEVPRRRAVRARVGVLEDLCGAAGVAHVSCLARQAQVAAERTFDRWHTCGLCEQTYHGVVRCALGWACWKTYVGRPETDAARQMAMTQLSNGLFYARHYDGETYKYFLPDENITRILMRFEDPNEWQNFVSLLSHVVECHLSMYFFRSKIVSFHHYIPLGKKVIKGNENRRR